MGSALPEQWGETRRTIDFYDVKADVEALLAMTGTPDDILVRTRLARVSASGPQRAHLARQEESRLARRTASGVGARAGFDIYAGAVRTRNRRQHLKPSCLFLKTFRDFPRSAGTSRSWSTRRCLWRPSANMLVLAPEAFCATCVSSSIYRGKGVDSGRKSVALGLIFQETSRTLTDQDADQTVAAIVERLRRELNATIRDQ